MVLEELIKATDPMGHIVKKHYNAFGQLTDVTDPAGDKIHYLYDLTGHTIQSWAQPVSGGNYLLSSAQYDAAGELLWQAGRRWSALLSLPIVKMVNPFLLLHRQDIQLLLNIIKSDYLLQPF